jgi:chromosomal replication initiator protein
MAVPKTTTVEQVIQAVSTFYHVQAKELTGRGRRKEIVRPRHVAMYLARHETEASLPEIGTALGGRDHTTVMYGVQKIEGLIEQDSTLRREIAAIRKELPRAS